jgi:hypothetical protein
MIRETWSADGRLEEGAGAATGGAELPLDGTHPAPGAAHALSATDFFGYKPLGQARRMAGTSAIKPYKTAG